MHESNDITGTAQSIFVCDIDSVFHVHKAFTSLWILKGMATSKVFFIRVKLCSFEIRLEVFGS